MINSVQDGIHEVFKDAIGQLSVKQTLSLYINAYKHTDQLPFLNFTTNKGGGKSFFIQKFREGLRRSNGERPKMVEVNAASIKNVDQFFEQVYPAWTENDGFLFLDEVHNLPYQLQQIFLNILDVKDDPVRTVQYEGIDYSFDFKKISFCGATTDQQKLAAPLRDRLRDISFDDYESNDLLTIFKNRLQNCSIDPDIYAQVVSVFRGNPRDAVVKAQDMDYFAAGNQSKIIDANLWANFCAFMGIHPYGLNNSEKRLVQALASNRNGVTLSSLACLTGFERSVIQKEYESILVNKGLMTIDGKRKLTHKGLDLAKHFGYV